MLALGSFNGRILKGKGLIRNFVFNRILAANTQNYNLRNDAIAAGWNGITPLVATVTVNSGVYVWSDDTATAGFDTGSSFPAGTTLSIINNGFIIGRGGNGVYRANGTAGGPAMNISYPVSITNNSYIAGGGGGGGSTGAVSFNYYISSGGGGAGGGAGGAGIEAGTGGVGGVPGQAGTAGVFFSDSNRGREQGWCGGGGGGRILPGVGGPATVITAPFGVVRKEGALGGGAGGAGGVQNLFGSGQAGGAGGSANDPGQTQTMTGGGVGAVTGGGGGGWGASGGNSAGNLTGVNYTTGAAGGKAVNLNSNTVTWVANGTRWGAIS